MKTKIWAHRGASGHAPENTMVAFEKAVEMRADGIELDVQLSKDGELVILHDETLERVSEKSGWVKDYTLSQLKELNVNKEFPAYGPVCIPTLAEVFDLMKSNDLTINVELKNGVIFYENLEERVISLAKEMGVWERIVLSTFNHYSAVKMKQMEPQADVGFLYMDGTIGMPAYAKKHNMRALHPALFNIQYPEFLRECQENEIALRVWTINEVQYMHLLYQNKVDAIITNYPDLALQVAKEYQ